MIGSFTVAVMILQARILRSVSSAVGSPVVLALPVAMVFKMVTPEFALEFQGTLEELESSKMNLHKFSCINNVFIL